MPSESKQPNGSGTQSKQSPKDYGNLTPDQLAAVTKEAVRHLEENEKDRPTKEPVTPEQVMLSSLD
jgi:hypothetical protein